ncbi:hypothetical protein J2S90_001754 [Arthrobacter bambusae]|uniref:Uncharacterized protein n=1 Tax=Arthrobacter bambusae TaxID=1338426 RepID=A0AAW8DHZ0_9MICC|nr:hypothetical protein [Arthrobacter bambusae]MDQ0129615.1 hypothetical protein [Arthrobacter bambusae]MDQ0180772.1 hypothetical protein [Arthrobacter bambusae]
MRLRGPGSGAGRSIFAGLIMSERRKLRTTLDEAGVSVNSRTFRRAPCGWTIDGRLTCAATSRELARLVTKAAVSDKSTAPRGSVTIFGFAG